VNNLSESLEDPKELINVFVYGTLRPGGTGVVPDDIRYYPQVETHVRRAIPARLSGAVVHNLGTYPGARPGEGEIQGEVLQVDEKALYIMDQIEGHPDFFLRDKVIVSTDAGPLSAWIYWAPPDMVAGSPIIQNGDWLKRRESKLIGFEKKSSRKRKDPLLISLVTRFMKSKFAWCGYTGASGRFQIASVKHVWRQGRIYLAANQISPSSIESFGMDLESVLHHPRVILTHPDPGSPVILEGWATSGAGVLQEVVDLFIAKYPELNELENINSVVEITIMRLSTSGSFGERTWHRPVLPDV